MSHTNSTEFYNLPQFLTGDKPAWLTDVNNAFSDIDAGLHAAQQRADTANINAVSAQEDATLALTNAAAADAKGAGAVASIEAAFDPTSVYAVGAKVMYNSLLYRCTVAITTPGAWSGSANWERVTVDSLIPASAESLPLSPSNPTTTKRAIDDLESGKANASDVYSKSTFAIKSVSSQSEISIGANAFNTQRISINNATLRVITGVAITTNGDACLVQCYFDGANTIQLRVRNVATVASTYNYTIWYI